MDHIDELVVKQKPDLLPGIAKDVQKAVADIGKIKLFIFSAAVVTAGHIIIKEIQLLILAKQLTVALS